MRINQTPHSSESGFTRLKDLQDFPQPSASCSSDHCFARDTHIACWAKTQYEENFGKTSMPLVGVRIRNCHYQVV